jgi:hypothetical protein
MRVSGLVSACLVAAASVPTMAQEGPKSVAQLDERGEGKRECPSPAGLVSPAPATARPAA